MLKGPVLFLAVLHLSIFQNMSDWGRKKMFENKVLAQKVIKVKDLINVIIVMKFYYLFLLALTYYLPGGL